MARERSSNCQPSFRLCRYVGFVLFFLVFTLQLTLFSKWTVIPHLRDSNFSFNLPLPSTQTLNNSDLIRILRADIARAFQEQQRKLSDISADLNSQLRDRQNAISEIGSRLVDKLELISSLEKGPANPPPNISTPPPSPPPPSTPCLRLRDTGRAGRIKWTPKPGMYLLVMCTGGQLSNRMACLRQHMLDAALLNRTLIFPSVGINYDYETLLDLDEPQICFGNDTFITLSNYLSLKGARKVLTVDRYICHVHSYQRQEICNRIKSKFTRMKIHFLSTEIPKLKTTGPWQKYSTKHFLGNFTYNDSVIAFGNMFGVGGREFRFHGSEPLQVSSSCRSYVAPSKPIITAATGYVNSYLGSKFMAVHLRRGDFFQHCMRGELNNGRHAGHPCFHPIRQVARCLSRRTDENPDLQSIFLATNGDAEEVATLEQFRISMNSKVPIVRLPGGGGLGPWAAPLKRLRIENDTDVLAMLEKTICVLSNVFYGTSGSTFSADIERLRDWWFLKSCRDGDLCGDEDPDTIPFTS